MHKKVGTITLEYDKGNGVMVSENFQAEFNNAIFRGDISAMEGTFSGTLTANAIDAVSNLTIAGSSVATTTVSTAVRDPGDWNDDAVWRNVHMMTFETPAEVDGGGWANIAIQYYVDDYKGDNGGFPCEARILVDGQPYFALPKAGFALYVGYNFYHELVTQISNAGYHTVAIQWRFFPEPTNVYPYFRDIAIRVDYVRK